MISESIPSVKNIFDYHAKSAIYLLQTILNYDKNYLHSLGLMVEEGCDNA